ncbi:MAG: hypothetical protein ACTSVI_05300 [Promethearchaeota archaeon]
MSSTNIMAFYKRFIAFKKAYGETWIDDSLNFFFNEAKRKWRRFPRFVNRVSLDFNEINRLKMKGEKDVTFNDLKRVIKERIPRMIITWFSLISYFPTNYMDFLEMSHVCDNEILFKIQLRIPMEMFLEFGEILDISVLSAGMNERDFVRHMFSGIVESINRVIKQHANTRYRIKQIYNSLENNVDEFNITMIISLNTYVDEEYPFIYFMGNLLNLLESELNIELDEGTKESLRSYQDKMIIIGKNLFYNHKQEILDVIKHFGSKCLLTGSITYLFEILIYIISRFDLSKIPFQDLLRAHFEKLELDEKTSIISSYLLDVVISQALIYSTFQANYTGFKKELESIFFLILQYYLGSFDSISLSDKLFRGEKVYERTVGLIKSQKGESRINIEGFRNFLENFLILQYQFINTNYYPILIRSIFKENSKQMIHKFFISFLKTSHELIIHSINILKKDTRNYKVISLENLIKLTIDFLLYGIEKIFFSGSLESTANRFLDGRGRFSPDRLASIMLEIVLYRELPFQDNQWLSFLLWKYRNRLDTKLVIKHDLLKKISYFTSHAFIITDQNIQSNITLLDEWLSTEIIQPIFDLYIVLLKMRTDNQDIDASTNMLITYLSRNLDKNMQLIINSQKFKTYLREFTEFCLSLI